MSEIAVASSFGINIEANDSKIHVGGAAWSYNGNTTINNYHAAGKTTEWEDMAVHFRSQSTDYQVAHDNALALRTPGTGQWFLDSEVYLNWKTGKRPHLGCIGVPGAGKTVLSSVIIEDLKRNTPDSTVLFIYNNASTQQIQTFDIFVLNLISQLLEAPQRMKPTNELSQLYQKYKSRVSLPSREDARNALQQELVKRVRVYIVMDALDEYRPGDASAQKSLVYDLESLGVKLLITSRTSIPLTLGNHELCEIWASDEDVAAYASFVISRGILAELLGERKEGIIQVVRHQAMGMYVYYFSTKFTPDSATVSHNLPRFLSPKLLLGSMARCQRLADVNDLLDSYPLNLEDMYRTILDGVSLRSPWALQLLHTLVLCKDDAMGARATLHYLASCEWKKGNIQDYVRPASAMVTACRGLISLVDRTNKEDEFVRESTTNSFKAFQICHLSAQTFLQRTLSSGRIFYSTRLEVVHRILQYTLRILDIIPQARLTPHIIDNEDRCPGCRYLSANFPLIWYHDAWLVLARSVERYIPVDLVDAYYGHRLYSWLSSHVSPLNTSDPLVHQAVSLCLHGLRILLAHHLHTHSVVPVGPAHFHVWSILEKACIAGNQGLVAEVLDRAHPLRVENGHIWTPALIAFAYSHWELVLLLYRRHLILPTTYRTCSHHQISASYHYHDAVTSLLTKNNSSIESARNFGWTSLTLVASLGQVELASVLLEKGSAVDHRDSNGWTSLMHACYSGKLDVMSLLLRHGAAVDLPDENGQTPLIVASSEGHLPIAAILIEHHAIIDKADEDGQTALILACTNGHVDIVELLLDHEASINRADDDGWTPLMYACRNAHHRIVALLLKRGALVDCADHSGQTPLQIACTEGNLPLALLLLEASASVDLPDKTGQTPLIICSTEGHASIVSLLIQHHASPDVRDIDGWAALLSAARNGHHLIVNDLLLASGASVNTSDPTGLTPLMLASSEGHCAVVRVLLEKGAAIDAVDQHGRTALIFAAYYGYVEVMRLLLAGGATVELKSSEGLTAMGYAKARQRYEAETLLR